MNTKKLLEAIVSAFNEIPNKALRSNKGGFTSTYEIASAIDKYLEREISIPISPIGETIADIAYLAGQYGYYSGDSRADMQHFVYLAKQFEHLHKNTDWEGGDLDYMTEIESFAKEQLQLVSKISFVPEAAKGEWDNIEVSPVKYVESGLDGDEIIRDVEVCEEGEEDMWSVYLHQKEGGVQCIADLPTKELAMSLRELLENAVKSVHTDLKLVGDLQRPVRSLLVEVTLALMVHKNSYKKSQVGYVSTQKLIDELNKLLNNEQSS